MGIYNEHYVGNIYKKDKYSDHDYKFSYGRTSVSQTEGVVGLYNLGNTCYMNSLLQCLKNLYPLTDFIFTNKFTDGKLINHYKQLLYNLISNKNEVVDATEYHNALGKIDSYFQSHEQRDSSKLFLIHIKSLIDDTKEYYNFTISQNLETQEPKLIQRYKNSKERNPSILYDFFFGFLKTTNICEKCGKQNKRYQPYSIIELNLKTPNGDKITDLEELIKNYERKKKSEINCSCGGNMTESTILGRIPPILVFKFQRSIDNNHISHKITYPNELYMKDYSDGFLNDDFNVKNKNLKFNLQGVMLHSGNANSGHKTAYSKNFINNKWYFFNDSTKYSESDSSVLNDKEAFMLFYISDSCKISDEKIKEIVQIADKNATKNTYYNERYNYFYSNQNTVKNYNEKNNQNSNKIISTNNNNNESNNKINNYNQNSNDKFSVNSVNSAINNFNNDNNKKDYNQSDNNINIDKGNNNNNIDYNQNNNKNKFNVTIKNNKQSDSNRNNNIISNNQNNFIENNDGMNNNNKNIKNRNTNQKKKSNEVDQNKSKNKNNKTNYHNYNNSLK